MRYTPSQHESPAQMEEQVVARLERTKQALAQVEAGQVIDGDEVIDWIVTWGTDKEQRPPR